MSFNSFVNIFNNSPIQPSDASYLAIDFDTAPSAITLEWVFLNPATLYPFTQFIQITGTSESGTYSITLPNALYSSTIQSTIIYNQALVDVTIYNSDASQSWVCDPSVAYYVGNTSNTTSAGDWNVFLKLGAGSSSVVASSLIDGSNNGGDPLEYNSGGLGAFGNFIKLNPRTYTYSGTDYVGNSSDRGTIVTWTAAGSGNYTLMLSSIAVGTQGGFITGLQNRSSTLTGGTITVLTTSPDLLNGSSDTIVLQPGDSTLFVTDGNGNWYTLCYSTNNQYAIGTTSYSLATSGGAIGVTAIEAAFQIQIFTGTYGTSPYTTVPVTYPTTVTQQYFINNQSSTNSLLVSIDGETDPAYEYTVFPNQSITVFSIVSGQHLYITPSEIVNETIFLPDGSSTAPSLTFVNDVTSGLYRDSITGAVGVTQDSTAVVEFLSTSTTLYFQLIVPTNAISYSFNGNLTTGTQYTTSTSSLDTYVGGTVISSQTSALSTYNIMINNSAESYQQAGINIYSVMRAYGYN